MTALRWSATRLYINLRKFPPVSDYMSCSFFWNKLAFVLGSAFFVPFSFSTDVPQIRSQALQVERSGTCNAWNHCALFFSLDTLSLASGRLNDLFQSSRQHLDPSFNNLNSRLHLAFILWVVGTSRQDRGAVMTRKVGNSLVGARLVAIRVADHGARVVRHDQLWHATIKP